MAAMACAQGWLLLLDDTRLDGVQQLFELGPCLLDGVEVG